MAHRIWSQVALTVKRPLVVLVSFPAGDLQPNHIIRLRQSTQYTTKGPLVHASSHLFVILSIVQRSSELESEHLLDINHFPGHKGLVCRKSDR